MLRTTLFAAGRSLLASRRATLTRFQARTTSFAVASKPVHNPMGIAKIMLISTPFVCVGAFAAKAFANYLEDFDLFVPDDDDD